jgi:diaminohydroxyphosphoribosylaminopyrimidine deaminase/5-amino-6-(5-phosphoribosylamino)uracil reductase
MNEFPVYESLMRHALKVASKGGRDVAPNPLVGAVIAEDSKVIASGFHTKFGMPHAEVEALRNVPQGHDLKNSTLYVTLEPCSHFGKTPPCTDAVIKAGIPRVVIGCKDPFPEVCGRGIAILTTHGISVRENFLVDESIFLNRRFFIRHLKKRPYIILKFAQTSDGFIARSDGSSKWISSLPSRALVHRWRATESAILVGSKTAKIDNPELTVRLTKGENPVRIVIDRTCSVPHDHHLFNSDAQTLLFSKQARKLLPPHESIELDSKVPVLEQLCTTLYNKGLLSLIVEGGAETLRYFIEANLWDEARVFTGPSLFKSGLKAPALNIEPFYTTPIEEDILSVYVNPTTLSVIGCNTPTLDALFHL